jgi:peptidoglycan/xylan/chitin deacetylase (PgdA/CDA1 family)
VTSARLPVTPGQQLTLRFWARSKTATSGVYLFFYSAAGKTISDPQLKASGGNPMCAVKETDGEWHGYVLPVEVPATAAGVAIWVHAYSGSAGITDLDDFALTGIPADAKPIPTPKRANAARERAPTPSPAELPQRKDPPVIILKLDDVKQVGGRTASVRREAHARWRELADYLAARQVKASFGVVCETLADATPEYAKWIKDRQASGLIEFWFHGWDHATHPVDGEQYNEFSHRSYEEQKERFDRSQKLALEKLGSAFRTFGPPGGAYSKSFDDNTARVIADERRPFADDPYMKVWLYPMPLDEAGKALAAAGRVTILDRVWDVNLEGAVGVPDLDRLIRGYAKHPDREYFVLQGHPAMWSPERFEEFGRILDFLVGQNAVFMTPFGYASAKGAK